MAKNKFRITEKDFLLANRRASREEEIAKYGKQVLFRTTKQKSKKVYDRKRLKKAGINSDDLSFFCFLNRINEAWSRRRNSNHLAETVTGVKASRTKGFSEVLRSGVGFSKTQIEADNNQRNCAWTEIYYYI